MAAEQHTDTKRAESRGAIERLFLWASDNKIGGGVLLAGVAAFFTVIGAQVNEALKAPETVEAIVRGTPHKPSDPDSKYQSVWEVTLTYDEGKEIENVTVQLPFKGVGRVKVPREGEKRSVTVTEKGVVFPSMRAQDQIVMTVWTDVAVESIESKRIRVTHKEGAGLVQVAEQGESPYLYWFLITVLTLRIITDVIGFRRRKKEAEDRERLWRANLSMRNKIEGILQQVGFSRGYTSGDSINRIAEDRLRSRISQLEISDEERESVLEGVEMMKMAYTSGRVAKLTECLEVIEEIANEGRDS